MDSIGATQPGYPLLSTDVATDVANAVIQALRQCEAVQRAARGAIESMATTLAPIHAALEIHAHAIARSAGIVAAVLSHRRRVGLWLSETFLRRPAHVNNLEEHLGRYRRHLLMTVSSAYIRTFLTRRNCENDPPGKLVATHPQVTRGPNNRRSIRTYQPAVVLHV